jgi:hypothetical protein
VEKDIKRRAILKKTAANGRHDWAGLRVRGQGAPTRESVTCEISESRWSRRPLSDKARRIVPRSSRALSEGPVLQAIISLYAEALSLRHCPSQLILRYRKGSRGRTRDAGFPKIPCTCRGYHHFAAGVQGLETPTRTFSV